MIPLIFTSKGNLPIDTLTHDVQWDINDERIVFTEIYKLDGEMVKQSSHVKLLVGASGAGEATI